MDIAGGGWAPVVSEKTSLSLLLVSTDSQLYLKLCELLHHPSLKDHSLLLCRTVTEAIPYIQNSKADLLLVDEKAAVSDVAIFSEQMLTVCFATPVVILGDSLAMELMMPKKPVIDLLSMQILSSTSLARSIYFTWELSQSRQQQKLQAQYDPLTLLPNRMLFRDLLQRAVARADRDHDRFVMLLLDLDNFRKVNDGYGQSAGDQCIREITRRLQGIMRTSDTLAHLSGDEFAIIMEHSPSSAKIVRTANAIVKAIEQPIAVNEYSLSIHGSIGISGYVQGCTDLESLIRHAELAMKEAKHQPTSSYQFYTEELNSKAVMQLHLKTELKRALRLDELSVHYQPRVDVKTRRLVGVEALVRWEHPKRGLLPPVEFIPFAEECGLIVPIGYWVLNQVCKDMIALDAQGYDGFSFAVNLSCQQFHDADLQKTIVDIVQKTAVDPSRLEFELTETSVMQDPERVTEIMQALSKQGIQFSLDDFGTGHSSFARLQQLPIQTLKIDRSFIMNLQDSSDNHVIVRAMINLAHNLNLEVVAEGVDHVDQAKFLASEHCDQMQGYLYGKPIPLSSLTALLQNNTRKERHLNTLAG